MPFAEILRHYRAGHYSLYFGAGDYSDQAVVQPPCKQG